MGNGSSRCIELASHFQSDNGAKAKACEFEVAKGIFLENGSYISRSRA
jgi:hypothetical protein